ncbi:MAG: ABC transporter ATP-binding protein [Deltaproteobacteria bacterium]|nr:ABC transporter ATP-binding protein [Deltaproteobacteria bacterium]MBW1921618.1 ABC transporter ATP-binding protein [Deltaproteobacteria bacterium]MBW1935604.1 ABC transporter ATP-binding protein [Deltaproteobacteria bacterium]MBW1977997.1 ABC transporter ATP-binding protein [Deltaproteobacteria bacterium]MBW2045896.1 ABC transporter ATP-binding protein [Deltaproteobacteria bacterium]
MTDILEANNLQKTFGKLVAVNDLSFEVKEGEILGMMGPNGAGKTTVFNLLTGTYKPDAGRIIFKGQDITQKSSSKRCRLGIGRTYQIPRPFDKMSVFENLLVAAVHGGELKEKHARGKISDIMDLTGLSSVKDRLAGGLPLLDRKRLEMGRALATQPSLILLDEIAGGLTEGETEEVLKIVKEIQKRGITIVWIEHILAMMSEGVDRLLVISEGRWLKCGNPGEVMNSEEVLQCYLGAEEE